MSSLVMEVVCSAARKQDRTTPPPQSVAAYQSQGLLGADGKIAMDYSAIENGGSMCLEQSKPEQQFVLGGMVFFEKTDGTCMLPPKTSAGNPCCTLFAWQPNAEGMYFSDCTMKCVSVTPFKPFTLK
jgi:hypothetical protein